MRELSQLVSYHILRYSNWDVVLPVVHEKADSAYWIKYLKTSILPKSSSDELTHTQQNLGG